MIPFFLRDTAAGLIGDDSNRVGRTPLDSLLHFYHYLKTWNFTYGSIGEIVTVATLPTMFSSPFVSLE